MSENSMELLIEKMMEQNSAANQLLADIAKEKEHTKRVDKWLPWAVCGGMVIVICVTFLVMHFRTMSFFSEYEFFYEEINLDAGEGNGNNVYFPGENAQYHQREKDD